MLKGKKKALAAQVLLGLMVAGNAYASGNISNSVGIGAANHLAIIGNPADVPTAESEMRALGADYVYNRDEWYISGSLNDGAAIPALAGFNGSTISLGVGGNVTAFSGSVTGKTVNIGKVGEEQAFSTFKLSVPTSSGNVLNIYNIAGTVSQTADYSSKLFNADGTYKYTEDVAGSVDGNDGKGTIEAGSGDIINIFNAGGNNIKKVHAM